MESGQSSSQEGVEQGTRRAWTRIFDCCKHGSGIEVSTQAMHGYPGDTLLSLQQCPSHSAFPFHGNGMWDGCTGHLKGCGAVVQPLVQNFPPTLRGNQS